MTLLKPFARLEITEIFNYRRTLKKINKISGNSSQCSSFSTNAGGHRSQLLHISDIWSNRLCQPRSVGEHRPNGERQSEDSWDIVQHSSASSGKCFAMQCFFSLL